MTQTSTPTSTADQSRTISAYSLQWNRFRIVRPAEDRPTFRNRTSLSPADLAPPRDPGAAFLSLATLLKPGGRIVVWVYPREKPSLERVINLHRAVSTRMPLPLLVGLSRLMAPVGGLKRRLMASKNRLV